jgi:DNA uptake protein ComE-like DNA-binding protein
MAYELIADGSKAEIITRYSDMIVIKVGETTKTVSPSQLREVSDSPSASPAPIADTPSPISIRRGRRQSTQPISELTTGQTESQSEEPSNDESSSGLDLNAASASEINDGIVGVGRLRSRRLVERRPAEGYRDWAEVADLNVDLQVDWKAIAEDHPHVVFNPVN